MIIGVPKEIKIHEYRIGLTPACVLSYIRAGHQVLIQKDAGVGAGFEDVEYIKNGATIVQSAEEIFKKAEMIIKVKEPQESEIQLFRPGQILYTYLHLAADRALTESLMKSKIHAVAYETIQNRDGSLPCLVPMSEIAGRLSVQEAAKYLEKPFGGRGILLGGIPGVRRGRVLILGGGVVGTNAAKLAVGMGAEVTIMDLSQKRLAYLDDVFGNSLQTLYSTEPNIEALLKESDVVIGAVLLPGRSAPRLIRREHLKIMKKGSVIVDVAVDQGGSVETIKPTTHDDPVYLVDGIVHYGVANMPGVVARTATVALTHQTLPFGLEIAQSGVKGAANRLFELRPGVNLLDGELVSKPVAESFSMPYKDIKWPI